MNMFHKRTLEVVNFCLNLPLTLPNVIYPIFSYTLKIENFNDIYMYVPLTTKTESLKVYEHENYFLNVRKCHCYMYINTGSLHCNGCTCLRVKN